ncbi:hypothetical protein ACHAW6_013916 [Cyclotella cf. meneghiniana]
MTTPMLRYIIFWFPCLLCLEGIAKAFSLTHPSNGCLRRPQSWTSRLSDCLQSTASSADTIGEVSTKVRRVSVCMGELCQCQGQYEYTGGAADAALQKLLSLDLPFSIDEVGCMGACGMGTMIAIDYENGNSIMTDGLEEAVNELGLQMEISERKSGSFAVVDDYAQDGDALADSDMNSMGSQRKEDKSNKSRQLTDVRERMREEAAKEDDQGNPWINMASYLAKKAMDRAFNRE